MSFLQANSTLCSELSSQVANGASVRAGLKLPQNPIAADINLVCVCRNQTVPAQEQIMFRHTANRCHDEHVCSVPQ